MLSNLKERYYENKRKNVFFITLSAFTQNHKPPNVLLIISDDQGFSELGSYMDFSDRNTLGAKNLEVLKK